MADIVSTGKFCTVETSDYCKQGIKKGNLVYVFGQAMQPFEDDPYKFNQVFYVTKTKEKRVVDGEQTFVCSGHQLKPVSKAAQKRLEKQLEADYAPKQESQASS